jgi:hypothetical protein
MSPPSRINAGLTARIGKIAHWLDYAATGAARQKIRQPPPTFSRIDRFPGFGEPSAGFENPERQEGSHV